MGDILNEEASLQISKVSLIFVILGIASIMTGVSSRMTSAPCTGHKRSVDEDENYMLRCSQLADLNSAKHLQEVLD